MFRSLAVEVFCTRRARNSRADFKILAFFFIFKKCRRSRQRRERHRTVAATVGATNSGAVAEAALNAPALDRLLKSAGQSLAAASTDDRQR